MGYGKEEKIKPHVKAFAENKNEKKKQQQQRKKKTHVRNIRDTLGLVILHCSSNEMFETSIIILR